MFCTTDLCRSVNKLKKEKKSQCTEDSVYVVCILSTVEGENTYM